MIRERNKHKVLYVLGMLFVVVLTMIVAEVFARVMEPAVFGEGSSGTIPHGVIGWLPQPGRATARTNEYSVTYEVNSDHMNDRPLEESLGKSRIRILALGDSHTFATGVSQTETWPNVLEELLFQKNVEEGTVYNGAVFGYSLGQYLLRSRQLQSLLHPQVVLIGFSTATDLYDLIPPRLGGFVYGVGLERTYYDLDQNGHLIEIRRAKDEPFPASTAHKKRDLSLRIRELLQHSALYRRLKRSKLAFWIAIHVRPGGRSLWPGMDTALKKQLNSEDVYRWTLAEQIIRQIAKEAHAAGAKVALVEIPYFAQIYDEIWEATFGKLPEYDRWIASEQLAQICERAGIDYVETLKAFASEARRKNRQFHFRHDGHPNREGHRLIAERVFAVLKEKRYWKTSELQ